MGFQSERLTAINQYNQAIDGNSALMTIGMIVGGLVVLFVLLKILTAATNKPKKKSHQWVCGTTIMTHLSKSGKWPTSFQPKTLKYKNLANRCIFAFLIYCFSWEQ